MNLNSTAMKTALWFTFLMLVLLTAASHLSAQQDPTSDSIDFGYFPYRTGDHWRVRNADFPDRWDSAFIYEVLRDSVDASGTRLFFLGSNIDSGYSIDTAGNVYVGPKDASSELRYRLHAKAGDRWRQKSDNSDSALPFYVTYMGRGMVNVFGQTRWVKAFNYWYDASAGGLPDSMWYCTHWLADGIGLIEEYYEPDALFYTSGAIIGGVSYGDMIASVQTQSTSIALRIAPNPFTEGATVSYHLDAREHVRLTLTNMLGRVLTTPIDALEEPGEHTAMIDGSDLPDGTYFYRLQTGSRTLTGTLIRRH